MLTAEGRVKIVDFGIAKISGITMTQTGSSIGTVAYMAPEQIRGEPVDQRTDLWALGVIIYEALSGQHPFGKDQPAQVMMAALNEQPVPLSDSRAELPAALDSLVSRLLAGDPAKRYADAKTLLTDLIALKGNQAHFDHTISTADRATDWETTIVGHFRNNPDTDELVGERAGAAGPSLYLARPIKITKGSCLVCHGAIKDAPPTMIAQYGEANGFGWSMGEIVGAQIVNVPMSIPLQRARSGFQTFMLLVAGVFVTVAVILNILLHVIVIRPVAKMSEIAREISLGNLDAPECEPKGKDEIASLARSFNRMRRSLVNAMNMLET